MDPHRRSPPPSLPALIARADALVGVRFADIALALGMDVSHDNLRTKGKFGDLIERALGAAGVSTATHDFPALRVELKTLPLAPSGKPKESTYVCTVQLHHEGEAAWESSWAFQKLSQVLFVATDGAHVPWGERCVRAQFLWVPSAEQNASLRADYEQAMGLVQAGRSADLTAHLGSVMQVRPKAAHSRVRTHVRDADGAPTTTGPRGFYLRPGFTAQLLRASTHASNSSESLK